MNDFNREAMIAELAAEMIKNGWTAEEAQKQATEEIDSMGATKTMRGECPINSTNPMACIFCPYGHMTECHYPQTCEEARCSHYQQELEAEGFSDPPDTWEDFKRDLGEK